MTPTSAPHTPIRIYPKESIVIKEKSILKRRKIGVRPGSAVRRRTPPITRPSATRPPPRTAAQSTKANDPDEETVKVLVPTESPNKQLKFSRHPVKVLIIESKGEYCSNVWLAIGAGIAHLLIGASTFAIMELVMFELDVHMALCSLGYHLFSAEAILSLNYANGWSTPMRLKHRKFAHAILNGISVILVLVGAGMANRYYYRGKSITRSLHGVTGYLAIALSVVCALTGACLLFGDQKRKFVAILHTVLGIICFILSTISLCTVLLSMEASYGLQIMVGFILYYTCFIFLTCFSKCMSRIT